jgi:chromosome partitioning protein
VNRKITNTAIGRDVREALRGYPVPVLDASLTQRVIFAEAVAQGLSVLEAEPNGQASAEIEAMTNELLEILQ